MATFLYSHKDCLEHRPPPGHPERVERLEAILAALDDDAFAALERRDAPLASREHIARVHPAAYIDLIEASAPTGDETLTRLDPDTAMSSGTLNAAYRAAGAAVAGVDAVAEGEASNAFCAVRPPGHHAEPDRAMGFCFFNNAGIAALHARAAHGLVRPAIVDFDVHHGNGSQTLAYADPELFYGSTHQAGAYPLTGYAEERGPAGNVFNAPVEGGADGAAWRPHFEALIDALAAFEPDIIIISAGFDAHAADPLAGLNLVEDDFAWASERLLDVANSRCAGRVVSVLEGGYDLRALAQSTAAHVRALMAN